MSPTELVTELTRRAKAASERLHVHVNTAHYRLGKIAERTGCDLRSISDVLELLIAINLAQGDAATSA